MKLFLYTMEGLPDDQKQMIEKGLYGPEGGTNPAAKALRVLLGTGH